VKRYRVTFVCDTDHRELEPMHWHCRAYDAEHAEEKFYNSDDGEAGWRVVKVNVAPKEKGAS
jgi:hypothetical protein